MSGGSFRPLQPERGGAPKTTVTQRRPIDTRRSDCISRSILASNLKRFTSFSIIYVVALVLQKQKKLIFLLFFFLPLRSLKVEYVRGESSIRSRAGSTALAVKLGRVQLIVLFLLVAQV